MRIRNGLIATLGTVTCVVALGLLSAPAGALTTTTTTVTDNASSIVTGGTLIFTATVSGLPGPPTGTVTWTVTGPSAVTTCAVPTPLDVNGKGTCSVPNAQLGTYSASATYSGDLVYSGSTGTDNTATVKAASTTAVTDNASSIVTGGSLIFTATVSGPVGTPTGSVTWSGSGPTAVNCASTPLSSGVGTCTVTNAQAGNYFGHRHLRR